MTTITALFVTAITGLRARLAQDEGQTSMEWLGIAAVAVAIIVFLLGGPAQAIGGEIQESFSTLIERVMG